MTTVTSLLTCLAASLAHAQPSPDQALDRLMQGNYRYVHDQLEHPNRSAERREALISEQKPFACIVACSDSRVPLEILFDQGVGDLFVIRVAGNVIGETELDSIRFATLQLKCPLVMVMGHENCGAVSAVLHDQTGDIPHIAKLIEPAVEKSPNNLEQAVKTNALDMKKLLEKQDFIQNLTQQNKVAVRAAYYSLQNGSVTLL